MLTKHISYQNSIIRYSISGIGPRVVLLHGFGENGAVWKHQVGFLSAFYQVIVPDLPGSGASELIRDADIDTYAEVLKAIVDNELQGDTPPLSDTEISSDRPDVPAIDKVCIIGHSMGGYITLAFAEKYPGCLNSFGLFHSSAFADTVEKKETRRKSIEFISANGAYAFLKTSIPGLFAKEFAEKFPEKMQALVDTSRNFPEAALIQYYAAMISRQDRTNVLRSFKYPVLFIIGELDTAVPLQSSLQQSHIPSQSYVNVLPRSAHMGMWEETDKANKMIFNFLNDNFNK